MFVFPFHMFGPKMIDFGKNDNVPCTSYSYQVQNAKLIDQISKGETEHVSHLKGVQVF